MAEGGCGDGVNIGGGLLDSTKKDTCLTINTTTNTNSSIRFQTLPTRNKGGGGHHGHGGSFLSTSKRYGHGSHHNNTEGNSTSSSSSMHVDSLEDQLQEHIRETLRLKRELRKKEREIVEWEEKYENMENAVNKERKRFEIERKEWALFKQDLLLVVRAADDYKTEAMITVQKYKTENSKLEQKVRTLEAELRACRI